MSIFSKERNYGTIVAPLAKMVKDLTTYISEQVKKIETLNTDKAEIDKQIAISTEEITNSEFSAKKIREIIPGAQVEVFPEPELPIDDDQSPDEAA